MMIVKLYTDGASRGNPGPSGIGVLAKDETGELIFQHYKYIGTGTNNQAEYIALIEGLKKLMEFYTPEEIDLTVNADSQLMVRQLNGEYKIKNKKLAELKSKIDRLISSFKNVKFVHIPRELNKEADKLANKALNSVE
ncbi:ribonuclease HI family protein [candidate division WOR-3 bacterium]|nr:ribonuclease HI family protein [candidate division WOR-3 bacterium]